MKRGLRWEGVTGSFKTRGDILLLKLGMGSQVFILSLCFITYIYISFLIYSKHYNIFMSVHIIIVIIITKQTSGGRQTSIECLGATKIAR